jgi:glycosyltransferase involved in cell wall biosynthesis
MVRQQIIQADDLYTTLQLVGREGRNEEQHEGALAPCRVVVIIPAFNEERHIGSVVLLARMCADRIIVVDDGSTDATAEIAGAAGALVVRHARNQGKGVALNTGFDMARTLNPEVVVTIDADGQHVPDQIAVVAAPVLQGQADIVVGSRYLENKSSVPIARIWGHIAFNFLNRQVSGVRLTDSQSGFRAFSARALYSISFNSHGFSVESEMQFLASEHQLQMVEVPITILYPDPPKRSVIAHGMLVLTGILRLVGQYRPLLFFGVPGMLLVLAGVAWAVVVARIYWEVQTLALGYALLSVLLIVIGVTALFAGVILHSVRGLLIDLVRPRTTELMSVNVTVADTAAPQEREVGQAML